MSHTELPIGEPQSSVIALPESGWRHRQGTVPQRFRENLETRLDRVLAQLAQPDDQIDTDLLSRMLSRLCADIDSGASLDHGDDYHWVVGRLTQAYAQKLGQRGREPLINTAAGYAQVVATVARAFPSFDYREALGLLICYMNRLFRAQQSGWKAIYEHIVSIPDSVTAKQLLNRGFFVEIREWADAGVGNLFSIRDDLMQKRQDLELRIQRIDQEICRIAEGPAPGEHPGDSEGQPSNVVDLVQARRVRLISSLQRERDSLRDQKENGETIAALIESDIREFEEKLQNARRACLVHPV